LASVGYISDEEEYVPVTVREGLGEVIVANKMNPIMPQRNTGLLFWGENTENQITSSLSDEHAILTLLRMKRELDAACLPFFFRANTEALRKDFDATLRSILNDYVSREELYDYVLVTDRSVNTPERIERKELWAEIAIEIVKGVEQIYIPIRIVKTGSLSNSNI
jgi:phage tail sheath protein FI